MRLLLLNTCGELGFVVLGGDAGVLQVETLPGRGAAEQLLPAVERVLAVGEVSLRQLDGIAVVHGPGSFTGVRVGLAAAKGLCEAGALRLVAVSRLALLAFTAQAFTARRADGLMLLDAGRGEFFALVPALDGGQPGERLLRRAEVLELVCSGLRAVTSESRVAESLVGVAEVMVIPEPAPESLLSLAMERASAGAWNDVALTDANYLRRPDAELALAERSR